MKTKSSQVFFHIVGCIAFLLLPYLVRPGKMMEHGLLSDQRSISDLLTYALMLAFFYLSYYKLVPKLFFQHHYVYFFLVALACFLIISFVPDWIVPHKAPPPNEFGGNHPPPKGNFFIDKAGRHLFIFLAVLLLSLLLRIVSRWRQAEKEKLQTELSYLKAQINPHFLFNTLNSIYALSMEKSDDTPQAVVKLSNMMRYVLQENTLSFVPLDRDLEYIHDYIDLQTMRFGNGIKIHHEVNGDINGKKIAPMILMPFIENAFKHGVNAAEDSDISIQLHVIDTTLELEVVNRIVTMHSTEPRSGMGIANTRKRLDLLYPAKYELNAGKNDEHFTVLLKLQLQ